MKLREMERRKRQIEEEIAKEKQHLAQLIQLEKARISSPGPPPVPPRPAADQQPLSLEDTVKDLEQTALELKEMAEKKSAAANDEALRQTAGAVREVAQVLLDAVAIEADEDDTEGYSEGAEEFSCGIEMGVGTEQSSGNVTPIPTQGELGISLS